MLNAITGTCQTHLAIAPAKLAYMETFKQRMKRIRTRVSFASQAAAAAAIGCERGTVGMWEAPSSPVQSVSGEWLFKVAKAYKVRPDWINDLKSADDGYPWEPGDYELASPLTRDAVRIGETPDGNYHVDQLDARGDMGDGVVNEDYPEVIRSVDFADNYIRAVMGFLPAPGRLKLVTGVGNSMVPHIKPGEAVLIDTGCNEFRGDGIYLINSGSGHQLKALQDRGDAIYVVSANDLYPPFPVKLGTIIGGRAYLLNRIERLS